MQIDRKAVSYTYVFPRFRKKEAKIERYKDKKGGNTRPEVNKEEVTAAVSFLATFLYQLERNDDE
jgi:hypothetical protein